MRALFGCEGADGFSSMGPAMSSRHGRLFLIYALEELSYVIAAATNFIATLA
jgi:hypothetical protein